MNIEKNPKQLRMIIERFEDLPELKISSGYTMKTFKEGDEENWCCIINATIKENGL